MRNTKIMKDRLNTAVATIFMSLSIGVSVGCLTFILKGEHVTVANSAEFFESTLIYSLISAIYFSIKATIYQINRERAMIEKLNKLNKIKVFEKNQKLNCNISKVS